MLYKVAYQYVNQTADIRTGSIAIEAKDKEAAKEAASKLIVLRHSAHKITSAKTF